MKESKFKDRPFTEGLLSTLKLTPDIDIAEWAEKYRVLTTSSSAEPGSWRNSRTPYLLEVMKELSPQSETREVVVMKGSQLGFTEVGINWLLYNIHIQVKPCSFLYLIPKKCDIGCLHDQRITPAIEEIPEITSLISSKSMKSIITKHQGFFSFKGSRSIDPYISTPFRYIFCDDIDGYPINIKKRGDPISLIQKRVVTFPDSKICYVSSPDRKGSSRIWDLYLDSDQRVYQVPCPHCSGNGGVNDGYFEIKLEYLRWTKGVYKDVVLVCPICGKDIKEYNKTQMLKNGKWVAKNPGNPIAGFYLSSLYSPVGWYSWATIVKEYENINGSSKQELVFMKTVMGLPYKCAL